MIAFKELMFEFRLGDFGDAWGHTMNWWFHVADELYFNRDPCIIPENWKFRPSPCGPSNDPDGYETAIVQQANTETLLRFGRTLNRYADILKKHGLDY